MSWWRPDPGAPRWSTRHAGGGPSGRCGGSWSRSTSRRHPATSPRRPRAPSRQRMTRPDDGRCPGVRFSLVTAGGASSLGSSFLEREPDVPALARAIVARGARFVPTVAAAPRVGVRACARPVSLDGRPLIGRIGWCDGLWIAAGHGPWGISTGPGSAALLVDLLEGRLSAPPAALDPGSVRVPGVSLSGRRYGPAPARSG